jgi:cysteinyl-tRNA synthetase
VKEFLASSGSADAFRMFCLLNPYRTNTNFSASKMDEASNVLEKLLSFVDEQKSLKMDEIGRWSASDQELLKRMLDARKQILVWLSNDAQTQG